MTITIEQISELLGKGYRLPVCPIWSDQTTSTEVLTANHAISKINQYVLDMENDPNGVNLDWGTIEDIVSDSVIWHDDRYPNVRGADEQATEVMICDWLGINHPQSVGVE